MLNVVVLVLFAVENKDDVADDRGPRRPDFMHGVQSGDDLNRGGSHVQAGEESGLAEVVDVLGIFWREDLLIAIGWEEVVWKPGSSLKTSGL